MVTDNEHVSYIVQVCNVLNFCVWRECETDNIDKHTPS